MFLQTNKNKINLSSIILNQEGFTLLEVIIAMAIMVLTFASILAVEGSSINATARAKQINIVAMLARNQMIETELNLEGKDFTEVKKEDHGTFPKPYEDYSWKTKITELKFPNLSGIMSTGNSGNTDNNGASGGQPLSQTGDMVGKLITSFLSKAIREVTVTIVWKKSAQEQTFSLSTYWVNLNHEFSLSE